MKQAFTVDGRIGFCNQQTSNWRYSARHIGDPVRMYSLTAADFETMGYQ